MGFGAYILWGRQNVASYYASLGRMDEAIEMYGVIMQDWEVVDTDLWDDIVEVAIAYFDTLCQAERWVDAANLIEIIIAHPSRCEDSFADCYFYLLCKDDRLFQTAYHTKRFDLFDQFYTYAFETLARYGNDGLTSLARYRYALSSVRCSTARHDDALRILSDVATDPEVLDPSNGYYYLKNNAKRTMARIFFDRILQAREKDKWGEVGIHANELFKLARDDADGGEAIICDTSDCSLILSAWNRINGRPNRAEQFAKPALQLGADMLSDDDESNDTEAWVRNRWVEPSKCVRHFADHYNLLFSDIFV